MEKHLYILNLVRSPHRKAHMEEQLVNCPFDYTFINSIDGLNKDISYFSPYYNHEECLKLYGNSLCSIEVAKSLSHIKAIQLAYDMGVEWAIIIEDDITILPSFSRVVNLLDTVDNDIDVLRLSYSDNDIRVVEELKDFVEFKVGKFKSNDSRSSYGYAIRKDAMAKYLNNAFPILHKVDKFLFDTFDHNVKIYQLSPRVIKLSPELKDDNVELNNSKELLSSKPEGIKNYLTGVNYSLKNFCKRFWHNNFKK